MQQRQHPGPSTNGGQCQAARVWQRGPGASSSLELKHPGRAGVSYRWQTLGAASSLRRLGARSWMEDVLLTADEKDEVDDSNAAAAVAPKEVVTDEGVAS